MFASIGVAPLPEAISVEDPRRGIGFGYLAQSATSGRRAGRCRRLRRQQAERGRPAGRLRAALILERSIRQQVTGSVPRRPARHQTTPPQPRLSAETARQTLPIEDNLSRLGQVMYRRDMGKRQRRRERQTPPDASETPISAEGRSFTAGRYRYDLLPAPDLPEHERAAAVGKIAGLGLSVVGCFGSWSRLMRCYVPASSTR